jgi:phage baseplate assembly protein W
VARQQPTLPTTYAEYDVWKDIWPERGQAPLAPVRVGVNDRTGKLMIGWPHVEQSIGKLYATRYHERILRQWVGSFVPHLLGKNIVASTFTRFFWAMAVALDLWEPCYRIARIRVEARHTGASLTSPEEIRTGHVSFAHEGVYMPRGHLGDRTPLAQRAAGIVLGGRGGTDP